MRHVGPRHRVTRIQERAGRLRARGCANEHCMRKKGSKFKLGGRVAEGKQKTKGQSHPVSERATRLFPGAWSWIRSPLNAPDCSKLVQPPPKGSPERSSADSPCTPAWLRSSGRFSCSSFCSCFLAVSPDTRGWLQRQQS